MSIVYPEGISIRVYIIRMKYFHTEQKYASHTLADEYFGSIAFVPRAQLRISFYSIRAPSYRIKTTGNLSSVRFPA